MTACISWPRPASAEQLEHVGPANGGAVDEVLALAAALERGARSRAPRTEAGRPRSRCRTGARPRSGRPPAGPTSPRRGRPRASRPGARSARGCPAAQTIASATFDFPEPFGPTTTATPGSRRTSTASGNDLKPRSLIERRIHARPTVVTMPGADAGAACSTRARRSPATTSARAPRARPPARRPSSRCPCRLPRCSPSISAAQVKRRSCGGPSVSRTRSTRPGGRAARAPPGAPSCSRRGVVSAYSMRSSNAVDDRAPGSARTRARGRARPSAASTSAASTLRLRARRLSSALAGAARTPRTSRLPSSSRRPTIGAARSG